MNKLILATVALTALAAPSFAGGPTVVADDPVAAYAPEPVYPTVDWSGVYAGLSYGRGSGDASDVLATFDFDRGRAAGAFLGYNVQRGRLVYGGELGYSTVSDMTLVGAGGDDSLDSLLDLSGRLGFSAGKALIYGAVGYSRGEMTVNTTDSATISGRSLGIGVDYLVTSSVFLGVNYTSRKLDGTAEGGLAGFDIDSTVNTVGLRLGIKF